MVELSGPCPDECRHRQKDYGYGQKRVIGPGDAEDCEEQGEDTEDESWCEHTP